MNDNTCRIGIFYDGTYFIRGQKYFYSKNMGWLQQKSFNELIEKFIRKEERNFSNYKIVYAAWHQGLFTTSQSTDQQRRIDRNRDIDLNNAGIETKYITMFENQGEKGIDVHLTVNALEYGLTGKIDVAVLVTGDKDFAPLIQSLIKHGIKVGVIYFDYENITETKSYRQYVSKKLLEVCSYSLNVNELEQNNTFKSLFRSNEKK